MARRNPHRGVSLFTRRDTPGLFAKWIDPDTGKPCRQSLAKLGIGNRAQALPWLIAKSEELKHAGRLVALVGRRTDVGSAWSEVFTKYRDHFAAEHGEVAAARAIRYWLLRFREFLTHQHVGTGAELTVRHLADYRTALGGRSTDGLSLAPATRNRHLGAVKTLLRWGGRNGYHRLPIEEVFGALASFQVPQTLPRVLDVKETARLIRACVKHDSARHHSSRSERSRYYSGEPSPMATPKYEPLAAFVFLMLLTGCRPGEALAMKWRDVHFDRKEIHVWGSKTMRERVVPLHDSPLLAALLAGLRLRSGGDTQVLGDSAAGGLRTIRRTSWNRLVKMAGLEHCPPKSLRSTVVAHVASASTDSEYLLEARFGHGAAVSKAHYRRPLHGLSLRGTTVEEWLGVRSEMEKAMEELGLVVIPNRILDTRESGTE